MIIILVNHMFEYAYIFRKKKLFVRIYYIFENNIDEFTLNFFAFTS